MNRGTEIQVRQRELSELMYSLVHVSRVDSNHPSLLEIEQELIALQREQGS